MSLLDWTLLDWTIGWLNFSRVQIGGSIWRGTDVPFRLVGVVLEAHQKELVGGDGVESCVSGEDCAGELVELLLHKLLHGLLAVQLAQMLVECIPGGKRKLRRELADDIPGVGH